MSVSDSCLIREAEPGFDDEAVAALMVDYQPALIGCQ